MKSIVISDPRKSVFVSILIVSISLTKASSRDEHINERGNYNELRSNQLQ